MWSPGELMGERRQIAWNGQFKKAVMVKRKSVAAVNAAAKAWGTANMARRLMVRRPKIVERIAVNEEQRDRLRALGGTAIGSGERAGEEGWEATWTSGFRCAYSRSEEMVVIHEDARRQVWMAEVGADEIATIMGVKEDPRDRVRRAMRAVTEGQAYKLLAQGVHMPSAREVAAYALKKCKGNRIRRANVMSIGSGMGMLERAVEEAGVEVRLKIAVEFNEKCIRAHKAAWGEQEVKYMGAIGSQESVEEWI